MRMLSRFGLAARMLAVALFFALPVVAILSVVAIAQDGSASSASSPWAQFFTEIQPALVAFATAVLGAFGGIVTWYARKIGGDKAAEIANSAYRMLIDQAAGWLLGERKEGRDPTLDDAVNYLRTSYPEVDKMEPSDATLGNDIIGALGRLVKS